MTYDEADINRQLAAQTAVLAVYATMQFDEIYDPADDPRPAEAHAMLAKITGDIVARGITEALMVIHMRKQNGID